MHLVFEYYVCYILREKYFPHAHKKSLMMFYCNIYLIIQYAYCIMLQRQNIG